MPWACSSRHATSTAGPGARVAAALGGQPGLPDSVAWPVWENHGPLSFVAAIDCASLTAVPLDITLPRRGCCCFSTSMGSTATMRRRSDSGTRQRWTARACCTSRPARWHLPGRARGDTARPDRQRRPGLPLFPPRALSARGRLRQGRRSCRSALTTGLRQRRRPKVPRQTVLDLGHVVPREVIHEFAYDVRDVDGADLIDEDLGIAARDDNFRPEDGCLCAGGGRDDGHRGPGVLLDADDEPEAPTPLLMASLGIAEVYGIDRPADHARSCDLAGTVRLVPTIRMLPSASYSHASASADRSSLLSLCMSARARSSHASRSSSRSARRMTSLVFSSSRRLASITRRSSSVGRNPTLIAQLYNNC